MDARDEAARLRITIWPGTPVAEPSVTAVQDVRRVDDWLGLRLSSDLSLVPVPSDVALYEVADTDPGDAEALQRLAGLGPVRGIGHPYDDLPISGPDAWARVFAEEQGRSGRRQVVDLEAERESVWQRPEMRDRVPVHLDEIGLRIRVLHQAVRHLESHAASRLVWEAWPDCHTDLEAWERFTRYANAALQEFHVRVYVDLGDPEIDVGGVYPTLYEVAWLQLINAQVAGETWRRCANETCGRAFLRQRGRGHYYSRSEGVLFCSASCARAQAQRAYRRRNRKGDRP